jgi:serralysin
MKILARRLYFHQYKITNMKKFLIFLMTGCLITGNSFGQLRIKGNNGIDIPCTTPTVNSMLAVDTTSGRQVANNYLAWENGEVILVKFMNNVGSKSIRNKIMQYAKEWEQYANITFSFVPDNTPVTNIRVRLGSYKDKLGHNSQVGISCNEVPQNMQTLNLDTSDFLDLKAYAEEYNKKGDFTAFLNKRVTDFSKYTDPDFLADILEYPEADKKWNLKIVGRKSRHEFGHALGLLHEQSYPGGIKWNTDTVYKFYAEYYGWGKEKVDGNVLEASDQFFTNGTTYDPKSVMHYDVKSWQTLDGFSLISSMEISEGDKKIIAALYPKDKKVSDLAVPKVTVFNFSKLEVKTDNLRKGLVIYPSFNLKTSAVLGKVHFVALLTTEDGATGIITTNTKYSWNNIAATYLPMTLLPSSTAAYNKGTKKNLELFFPFKEMPALNGKKVKVMFLVYVYDNANNKFDRVAASSFSMPLNMPGK